MIQVYAENNTNYDGNGDIVLLPIEAYTESEINGTWQATLVHPIDPEDRWKYLTEQAVVRMPSWNGSQLYRIVNRVKSGDAITCTMYPIFYDAMGDCFLVDVRPTSKTGQQALDLMLAPNNKYSGWSDISKTSTAYYVHKNFLEALAGDEENSFLNRWGGEIEFDNFTVKVWNDMGADNGLFMEYGLNIQTIEEEVDTADVITRVYAQAFNGRMKSTYVDSPYIGAYPTIKTALIVFENIKLAEDADDEDANNPDIIICQNQASLNMALLEAVENLFDAGLDKPTVNITLTGIVDLSQIQGFDIKKQNAGLGDTIHLKHSKLNIEQDARITYIKYDAARERVEEINIGNATVNLYAAAAQTITSKVASATEAATEIANNALTNARKTNNYFWHDASGAHVSDTKDSVSAGNSQTIASAGTVMMRNGKLVTSWTGGGTTPAAINFYDGTDAANLMAAFSSSGVEQYIAGVISSALTATALSFYTQDPNHLGEDAYKIIQAMFGTNGVDLYAGGIKRLNVASSGVSFYAADGTTVISTIKPTEINLGKNSADVIIKFCQELLQLGVVKNTHDGTKTAGFEIEDTYDYSDPTSQTTIIEIAARNSDGTLPIPNQAILSLLAASYPSDMSTASITANRIALDTKVLTLMDALSQKYEIFDTSAAGMPKAKRALADGSGYAFAESYLGTRNTITTALTSDLDDLTDFGIWFYNSTAGHAPSNAGGLIFNLPRSSTYTTQIAFANNSASGGESKIYTRHHNSSGFGSWKQIQLA